METKLSARKNYLDWLRVLGILLVFAFHSSRLYNVEDWNVKNSIWYPTAEAWVLFASSFMMPLMFVISGASLFYALRKDGIGKFVKDKVLRLLVPLFIGALSHLSLQSYLWDKTHGLFSGNYFQFLPQYYPDSINWFGGHLWYLWYLFLFSFMLYPLLRWMKGNGSGLLSRLDGWLSKGGVVYILALPILILYLLPSDFPFMAMNGGYPYLMYLFFLLWGFVLVSDERLNECIRRLRWISLSVGMTLVIGFILVYNQIADPTVISPILFLAGAMRVFGGWICVLAFFGLGMQHLTARTERLDYANQAVLPFYILHQTVIQAVAYFVLQWAIPDALEWAVVVTISFAIIMLLYEFLVRRFNVMRILFGMKPLRKLPSAQASEPALAR